ncbi:MAG: hypothetical protein K0R39_888 [Symbiobacteriaceae bacterium]|nr:hypothetical protein [Symbiobacteriaceae bacterium]
MKAPAEILRVWNHFAGVPMETFTKGWWHARCGGVSRQRTIAEMVEHRKLHGAGGNCFDLAIWLRHAFCQDGVPARVVGHDLCTEDAHVAVVATGSDGGQYLCDMGDLWLQPIRIDGPGVSDGWHAGFFPGREVQIAPTDGGIEVLYRRSTGKVGRQSYDLRVLSEDEVMAACNHCQNLLRRPFCEMLLPHPETGVVEHWEYDKAKSFWNLAAGPVFEAPCGSMEAWGRRISQRTGMSEGLIAAAFAAYGVSGPT